MQNSRWPSWSCAVEKDAQQSLNLHNWDRKFPRMPSPPLLAWPCHHKPVTDWTSGLAIGRPQSCQQFESWEGSKSGPILRIVWAVQKCCTILESLDTMKEYHNDRETTAAIIDGLSATAQERWFHWRPNLTKTQFQRSVFLLNWFEEERKPQ